MLIDEYQCLRIVIRRAHGAENELGVDLTNNSSILKIRFGQLAPGAGAGSCKRVYIVVVNAALSPYIRQPHHIDRSRCDWYLLFGSKREYGVLPVL